MVKDDYKLTGSGSTTRTADRDLRTKTSELVKKLKGKNVSVELAVARSTFTGIYTVKTGQISSGPSEFKYDSENGWSEVQSKAGTTANLRKYDKKFVVDQYLNLTSEQLSVVTGTRSPAGPMDQLEYSFGRLRR
jgi:hypothetical protein